MRCNTQQPRPAVIAAFHHRLMLESQESLPPGWAYYPVQRLTRPEPRAGEYECDQEPERHPNFRQKAKGQFIHRTAEPDYYCRDIPFVVLAMALSGAALLVEFGAMVCGVAGRMFWR